MLYDKVQTADAQVRMDRLRHLMRITLELGSDVLKIATPPALDDIPEILDGLCEDIQIFFAGGELCSDEQLLEMTERAVRHGAAGLCMGRNIFQRDSADGLLTKLSSVLISEGIEAPVSSRV